MTQPIPKAVLVDLTRCIGCRSCQVSCKAWNGNEGEKTSASATYTNPPAIDEHTFTQVRFVEHAAAWSFVKSQCMHCLDPACASACPPAALKKTAEGPVTYDYDRCVGCRYCMMACPFGSIGYEWEKVAPRVRKCTFCVDRAAEGQKPACVKACPTGALTYGDRDKLLDEAERRLATGRYVQHVFGKEEAGGTSWLYISAVPFETLGFRTKVPKEPLPALTWASLSKVPMAAGGLIVGLSAIAAWRNRGAKEDASK
ncbi:MAG TPA: 4Fe-4S dicluster domain-containing protein [Myxococcales bacterium]|nr:4Fe-4S dicluster domain-containing protein [Myxococcales bacterium]